MLSAAFRQYLAERWLLNGRFNSGKSEMDETEPIGLIGDHREDCKELDDRETDETRGLSERLPQPHKGAGLVVLCSPPDTFNS